MSVGTIERVYYTVPGHYGYGPEFPGDISGLREAVAHAKSTICKIPGGYSRAFVERRFTIRWTDEAVATGITATPGGVDMPVERDEIFLTDTEKEALD